MNIDRNDDQAVFDALLDLLRRETNGKVRVFEDDSYIELSNWEGKDLTEPVRLHTTVPAVAAHLRDMEDDADLVFPNVQPIIGAVQLFSVHVDEAISMRESGATELIVHSSGVRSEPPGTSQ